jgi:hypothetical protein
LFIIDLVVPHKAFAESSTGVTIIEFSSLTTFTFSEKSKDNSHNGHLTFILLLVKVTSTLSSITTGNLPILDIFL